MASSGRLAAAVGAACAVLALSAPGRADEQAGAALPLVTPEPGMVIRHSTRLAPGTYRFGGSSDRPALRIEGAGVTVDLSGVTIEGGDPAADPDGYIGTGLSIEDAADVTIRGGAIRGYKVGILARRTPRLSIAGTDASYNWKARLWSGIERESLVDWMSYHNNEKDEWLRYGAAIYLHGCDGCRIDGARAVQGQNGLMVTHSTGLTIRNNTFSWNSGVGLGLYRVTDSRISSNRLDWNVRGYSHGFYFRGQDSTAILMYEQSSRNVVTHNSATHGGDGLFLWAGQSTMDTGQGGANDNTFSGNDFSHAVANGIEATFSRNTFTDNRIEDCWHGVWAGYSYDSVFARNTFARNSEAIAIEHGQNIRIAGNAFSGDQTAIRLWANATQDPNWGYPKARDTRSRGYRIEDNRFDQHKVGLDLTRTSAVDVSRNTYTGVAVSLQTGVEVSGLSFEGPPAGGGPALAPSPVRASDEMDAMLSPGALRGRSTIVVDEWGPFDYRSPKLWPTGKPTERPLTLKVIGPEGRWTLASVRGARVDRTEGTVPGEVALTPTGRGTDVDLTLEYVGGDVVTPRGQAFAAGARVPVRYTQFAPAIDWTVRAWAFDAASDPLTSPEAFAARLQTTPARTERSVHLSYLTSRALLADLPTDRIALRAEGQVDLPGGRYELQVISDDGVRVWVDDVLVIDRWDVHESVVDAAPVTSGRHRIRVDYFEMTGWAELQVRFQRR